MDFAKNKATEQDSSNNLAINRKHNQEKKKKKTPLQIQTENITATRDMENISNMS